MVFFSAPLITHIHLSCYPWSWWGSLKDYCDDSPLTHFTITLKHTGILVAILSTQRTIPFLIKRFQRNYAVTSFIISAYHRHSKSFVRLLGLKEGNQKRSTYTYSFKNLSYNSKQKHLLGLAERFIPLAFVAIVVLYNDKRKKTERHRN